MHHEYESSPVRDRAGLGPCILVFGASGYIGTNLVKALIATGVLVRAAARDIRVMEARGWNDIELVAADALLPDSLLAALESVDTAYYLVHSMAPGKGSVSLT